MRKRRIIYIDLDAAESSNDDEDDGKIIKQVVQDQKPRSDAYNRGLESVPSGKIDHRTKPERRSNGLYDIVCGLPCGKYYAEVNRKLMVMAAKVLRPTDDPIRVSSPSSVLSSSVETQLNRMSHVVEGVKDPPGIVSTVKGALQDHNCVPSGKIDHAKKPERRSNGSSSVSRQSWGKYSAEFKDPLKRGKARLGFFDTKEEADLAWRLQELEVFRRSMLAMVDEVLMQDKADEMFLLDIKPVQSVYDPFQLFSPRSVLDTSSSAENQLNRTNNVVVEGGKDPPAIVASVEGALRENTNAADGVEDDDDLEEELLVSGLLQEPELCPSSLKFLQDGDELDDDWSMKL